MFLEFLGILFIAFSLAAGSVLAIIQLISCLVDIHERLKKLEDKQNEQS